MKNPSDQCERCDEVLAYLIEYYVEHGFAPSYRQIGERLDLTSKSSVHNHIQHLRAAGLVKLTGSRGAIPITQEEIT